MPVSASSTAFALESLHALVMPAAENLRALGSQPLAIACAPHKFNDAGYDDYWCAVQIGTAYWEQSQFFESREPWDAVADEKTHLGRGSLDGQGFGTSLLGSSRIVQARAILNELETGGWRDIGRDAIRYEVILALIIQYQQPWIWTGDPNGGPGSIYVVHESGIALFAEEDDRLDHRIGDPNLICPEKFHPESFSFLSPAARRQFLPELSDPLAAGALHAALIEAGGRIRQITDRPVLIKAGARFPTRHRHPATDRFGSGEPEVIVDTIGFSQQRFQQMLLQSARNPDLQAQQLERFSIVDFEALWAIAVQLHKKECRRSFELAMGVDTFDIEGLFFLFVNDDVFVIHRTNLFVFENGSKLRHVGSLKRLVWLDRSEEHFEAIAAGDQAVLARL